MREALPEMLTVGLPNTLILAVSAALLGSVLGMLLAVAGHLPHAAGCAGRRGSTPTCSAACRPRRPSC